MINYKMINKHRSFSTLTLSIFFHFSYRGIHGAGRFNMEFKTEQCKFTTLKRFLRVNCNSICMLDAPAVIQHTNKK